jgi:hypothetical protein
MKSIILRTFRKAHVVGMFVLAVGLLATPVLLPSVGNAQDARVAKTMAALKDQTTKLGPPQIDGIDEVGGRKNAPALFFGSTKMNNNFSVVDAVAKGGGRGTAATLFVKSGDDYIRVATNVSTRIGRRGLGTILTGAALKSIKAGNAYYGKTSVLGTPYVSGYEPIKDVSGATIGVYFVGYTK